MPYLSGHVGSLCQRQHRAHVQQQIALDDGGAVVNRAALLEHRFEDLPRHAPAEGDAGRHELRDGVPSDDDDQRAAAIAGKPPRRGADGGHDRHPAALLRAAMKIEAHQRAPQLGLEDNDE